MPAVRQARITLYPDFPLLGQGRAAMQAPRERARPLRPECPREPRRVVAHKRPSRPSNPAQIASLATTGGGGRLTAGPLGDTAMKSRFQPLHCYIIDFV